MVFIAALLVLLFVSVVISLAFGEVKIGISNLSEILDEPSGIEYNVLTKIYSATMNC